ncbi:hypothetical protein L218DRAFT_956080 [Marasmius fiardii PR-910]|nr:hypothetical protein L218DRAFT_956080 [Marasmius fiardii PR-910]
MGQNKFISSRARNVQNHLCRATERDLRYYAVRGQSISSEESFERPTKRRRTSYGKDERGNGIKSLFLTSKPTINRTPEPLGNPYEIDSRTQDNDENVNSCPPHFPGSYDLYPVNEYPSEGPPIPFYRALYASLSQSHPNFWRPIGQCHIPDQDSVDSDGLLLVNDINNPLAQEHSHLIRLNQIMTLPTLSIAFDEIDNNPETLSYHSIGNCSGLSASLHVDSSRLLLDLVDSFGELKMRRVWMRASDDGSHDKELFQGYFLLSIFYGEEYEARGFPPIVNHQLKFWGIRRNKDRC